jgi:hypothetical protein
MIIKTEIDGRPATVQYLNLDREPTNEEDADMIYVIFDDGETMWAYTVGDDEPEDDEDDEYYDEDNEEPEDEPEQEPEEDMPEDLAAQSETTTDSASRRPKINLHIHR